MYMLLKYQYTDGLIRGVWQSVVASMLAAQIVPQDPVYGYLQHEGPETAETMQSGYYVAEGVLRRKTHLTIDAHPVPMPADGASVCAVSVTPFAACTLLVDGAAYALSEADPVLELTADAPHTFRVSLVLTALVEADPITIEAL